ncbi:LCP family protein, partial [Streptomyces sp. NPDC001500]
MPVTPSRFPRRPHPRRRAPRPPARRRRPRWAVRAATTLSVVLLAAAGIGHSVISSLDAGIAR